MSEIKEGQSDLTESADLVNNAREDRDEGEKKSTSGTVSSNNSGNSEKLKPKIGDSKSPPEPIQSLGTTESKVGNFSGTSENQTGSKQRRPKIGDSRPAPKKPAVTGNGKKSNSPKNWQKGTNNSSDKSSGVSAGESILDTTLPKNVTKFEMPNTTGRYLACVHVTADHTQLAILEGRTLVEHYVSKNSDEISELDGNIYMGEIRNILPGMEAAFVDIGTPKNAVLYQHDVKSDAEDLEESDTDVENPRIEQVLKNGQFILCQVIKNPIGVKGARLTQSVSLAGRYSVLVPGGKSVGISKRLDDQERRRLRKIVDKIKQPGFGYIIRTAGAGAKAQDIETDIAQLYKTWLSVDTQAKEVSKPTLLYKEPHMVIKVLREELSEDFRGVVLDNYRIYCEVRDYVKSIAPELAERIYFYDLRAESLPVFEYFHVHEQLHKALDRKVWLPSGGSLVIDRTEALTVIDVNTSKNVGKSNLEETVFKNNMEAAEEIARQLRLRDLGGIIVIDFIDMMVKQNRIDVMSAFKSALSRDKTRTQAFDISELGLVEMTRKRVSEGLVESLSHTCPTCDGRGVIVEEDEYN
jgi:ribonuclease E